jgi:hypothetical protein
MFVCPSKTYKNMNWYTVLQYPNGESLIYQMVTVPEKELHKHVLITANHLLKESDADEIIHISKTLKQVIKDNNVIFSIRVYRDSQLIGLKYRKIF